MKNAARLAALCLVTLLAGSRALEAQEGRPRPGAGAPSARDAYHFGELALTDGDQVYDQAEIYVRVKEAGGGYTRADYLDQNGRRLGFYEAFEVVSRSESALREWAIRNFPDRTTGTR